MTFSVRPCPIPLSPPLPPHHLPELTQTPRKGALLNEPPSANAPLSIRGSALLALAASREEVERALREDVYAREGVWDLSKVRFDGFSFCGSV